MWYDRGPPLLCSALPSLLCSPSSTLLWFLLSSPPVVSSQPNILSLTPCCCASHFSSSPVTSGLWSLIPSSCPLLQVEVSKKTQQQHRSPAEEEDVKKNEQVDIIHGKVKLAAGLVMESVHREAEEYMKLLAREVQQMHGRKVTMPPP
uniref:Uncharacterized protein n=1 Tax=Guillardia theta TaxID=55529 RepID=A0A7S4H9V5_GUITH|mmetsp:Transcript_11637/g.40174  ORF Transcript_11637/g.40174 Transcript_11637/m.40174 type:complete len:148 (+) Transcript_11637:189-632(+)